MNCEKAYILGMALGAGTIRSGRLRLKLPYKNWGANYRIAAEISKDIMNMIKPTFEQHYQMQISWRVPPSDFSSWVIETNTTSEFEMDLEENGLPTSGELRKIASISKITEWSNDDHKRHFIAGLADSIGSVKESHRRFTPDYQILSLEFKGDNFLLVRDVCNLLRSLNCHADQILWNHPNQHSGTDPFYATWKKGFKLRVLMDNYVAVASFLMRSKMGQSERNLALQSRRHDIEPACPDRVINITPKTVHPGEGSDFLPVKLRGYHFMHNKHICAALGCEFAPYDKLKEHIRDVGKYVNPFPILVTGSARDIARIIRPKPIMSSRKYKRVKCDLPKITENFRKGERLLFESGGAGYPIREVLNAVNFVLAASAGDLFGKRPRGSREERLERSIENGSYKSAHFEVPEKLTPLIVTDGRHSALVGPENPVVYGKLVTIEKGILLKVRDIREDDL